MVDALIETTIEETLARAAVMGHVELQERISFLSSKLQEMTKSRDGQKEQKLRYKCQVTGLQQQLHQAQEDLQQASIGRQDQGAGIGATNASYFELQLSETRGQVREREAEVDAYRMAFERATAAKEDAETKYRLYRERMTQELLVAESKVAHLQTINESNSAKLYDSRARCLRRVCTNCLTSFAAPCAGKTTRRSSPRRPCSMISCPGPHWLRRTPRPRPHSSSCPT